MLEEFIYHLDKDDELEIGEAPKDASDWLETVPLPMELRRFFQWHWLGVDESQIGHIAVMSIAKIMADTQTATLLQQGLFLLGAAPNGDPFVLDISREPCRPGFVSHEELNEEWSNAREMFVPIARSLESLLYRIIERMYVPTDVFAAGGYLRFVREERGHAWPESELEPPEQSPG